MQANFACLLCPLSFAASKQMAKVLCQSPTHPRVRNKALPLLAPPAGSKAKTGAWALAADAHASRCLCIGNSNASRHKEKKGGIERKFLCQRKIERKRDQALAS